MPRRSSTSALTVKFIEAIKPPATGQVEYRDGGVPGVTGLVLRVGAKARTWDLIARDKHGRQRRFPLHKFLPPGETSLKAARDAARLLRAKVKGGWTPEDDEAERQAELEAAARAAEEAARIAAEQARRDELTLGVLVRDWCEARLDIQKRKPGYVQEVARAIKHLLPEHWDRPAHALTRADVASALFGCARFMAARTVVYGRAVYGWAQKADLVEADPFARHETASPVKRERVLSDAEVTEVWTTSLSASEPFGSLVRLLLLTGQRREECAGLTWEELSADRATWTIAAARTKNSRTHAVHLADLARAQLPADAGKGVVFGGSGSKHATFQGWSKSKDALDAKITASRAKAGLDPMPPWRLHDLRRTCATGMQALGVRTDVIEAALNHTSGTRAGLVGVYQTYAFEKERAAALDAWAAHVQRITTAQPDTNNVLPFPVAV